MNKVPFYLLPPLVVLLSANAFATEKKRPSHYTFTARLNGAPAAGKKITVREYYDTGDIAYSINHDAVTSDDGKARISFSRFEASFVTFLCIRLQSIRYCMSTPIVPEVGSTRAADLFVDRKGNSVRPDDPAIRFSCAFTFNSTPEHPQPYDDIYQGDYGIYCANKSGS